MDTGNKKQKPLFIYIFIIFYANYKFSGGIASFSCYL